MTKLKKIFSFERTDAYILLKLTSASLITSIIYCCFFSDGLMFFRDKVDINDILYNVIIIPVALSYTAIFFKNVLLSFLNDKTKILNALIIVFLATFFINLSTYSIIVGFILASIVVFGLNKTGEGLIGVIVYSVFFITLFTIKSNIMVAKIIFFIISIIIFMITAGLLLKKNK